MNLFGEKIRNIYDNMLKCYNDSALYSSSISGFEREIFQNNLLSKILPSNYRIGSGTIIDAKGNKTGQIDTVIELPFSISFPVSSESNRLFLADTVGATFEIKSDLYNQWDEAIDKVREIKQLNRYKIESGEFAMLNNLKIPTFIVAYKGYKKKESVFKKISKVEARYWPNGIFIIDSGIFLGLHGGNGTLECTGEQESVLGFISYLYEILQEYSKKTVNLSSYTNLLR